MTVFSALSRLLLLLPLALALSGCFVPSDAPADEEKDPHYLAGKNRMSSLDYDGAISSFENALLSNPKSAAAHLQLGFLYEERKNNYGAAIYHFDKHLELRPESNMAESVKLHLLACKLELARTVPFALVNRQVQDELRRLYATNAALRETVEGLQNQILVYSNKVVAANQAAVLAQQAQVQAAVHAPPTSSAEPDRRPVVTDRMPTFVPVHPPPPRPATPRTHLVKAGESFASIAKKYNVKTTALQAANPSIEPRRLRAGQILNLPAGRN